MSFYPKALDIVANGKWLRSNGTYESTIWKDSNDTVAKGVIDAKVAELQADYDSKRYQRDRKYPELGEQFDLLFKDIDSGKVSKDGGFYKAIKAVKDAHPKPSE